MRGIFLRQFYKIVQNIFFIHLWNLDQKRIKYLIFYSILSIIINHFFYSESLVHDSSKMLLSLMVLVFLRFYGNLVFLTV